MKAEARKNQDLMGIYLELKEIHNELVREQQNLRTKVEEALKS